MITRGDIKVFMPPIGKQYPTPIPSPWGEELTIRTGGLTVYIFGDATKISDPDKRLALRIHDECNGSDVFGSDICTCRPYLIFGIEEAVKEAQKGGTGVVIYFRKEGRALGEVTKVRPPLHRNTPKFCMTIGLTRPSIVRVTHDLLRPSFQKHSMHTMMTGTNMQRTVVYNARKRGEDRASDYFKRTEMIAGVKDMRFQALMPDILHWLGITKIDRMLSMSKYVFLHSLFVPHIIFSGRFCSTERWN